MSEVLAIAAIAIVVGVGLLVPVRVAWGGSVPVGAAPAIAAAALLPRWDAAASLAAGLLLGASALAWTRGRSALGRDLPQPAAALAGALAGVLVADLLLDGAVPTVVAALAASAGLVLTDLVRSRRLGTRLEVRAALPVHLTLACAGILIAVAVEDVGVAMAGVAAFPLLITRFSFERYAAATATLEQTVQALGLVPELAGLAPLGHSERSAAYATALAQSLGLDRRATTRVVTATRLHHLGAVPIEAGVDETVDVAPGQVAAHGARILRDAGLPGDVADLLAAANADSLDATAPSLEAAVVRVAATFDELVGEDRSAADRGLALVSAAARDPHSRRVVGALLALAATEVALVDEAIAAGDRFRDAATGVDLATVTSGLRTGSGELLPFTRRP